MPHGGTLLRPSGADPGDTGRQFLVWAWRRIIVGRGDCPAVARALALHCGEDAGEVLATLSTFLQALSYTARRRLQVGHPGCAGITADEQQLLALVAAAQAGEAPLMEAHLRWLVRPDARIPAAIAAGALGTALSVHGLVLTLPEPVVPLRRPPASVPMAAV